MTLPEMLMFSCYQPCCLLGPSWVYLTGARTRSSTVVSFGVCTSATDHVDLGVGVSHVADDAAVLHAVQVLSHHNILVAWRRH